MSNHKASHRNFTDEATEKEEKINDEKEILKLSRQIDERLEQKADAHNLTAVNVKSILTVFLLEIFFARKFFFQNSVFIFLAFNKKRSSFNNASFFDERRK